MVYWTGFGESNDEKWVAACSQTMGKDGMKMKAWNEDDQLGQVGMPNLDNILSGCGLADGG
jgi:hypothetical protein